MENKIFTPMEIDAIGEIMNISLGSSATAVSNLLDHRVDITTPSVSVINVEDFTLGNLEPAIGLEIKYVSGLEGSNIMLLKRSDIKMIVDILMGTETTDEEFELNELTISAVCEVMNQMMGAASTALSDFLGRLVNISTPQSFELDNLDEFKRAHFPVQSGPVVVVRFLLRIENALESEFLNVMSVDLARELVSGFGLGDDGGEDIAAAQQPAAVPTPPIPQQPSPSPAPPAVPQAQPTVQPAAAQTQPQAVPPVSTAYDPAAMAQQIPVAQGTAAYPPPGVYAQPYPQQAPPGYYPAPEYPYPPQMTPPQPKVIATQPVQMPQFDAAEKLGEEQAQNLDLIMSVPLEVSVEIGRTRRKVQDVLSFSKGSLVVLDKLAGDQVDLFVNGKCIAKGDVVVIDDNFGIRITEIVQRPDLDELPTA